MDRLRAAPALWSGSLLVLLLLFGLIQANSLTIFERDYDEGVYLAQAHLVYAGHTLYSEIESPLLPHFTWGMAALFTLAGGPSVLLARLATIALGAVGLLSIAWCGQRLARAPLARMTGLLAALLLLLLPRWLFYGQVAMPDIPALSLSLLSVALALQGWRGERRWYFLAGLAAGLAFGVKQVNLYSAPLLALAVVLGYGPERPFQPRRFLLDGSATLVGFLLPLLAILPFVDAQAAYEDAVLFHWQVAGQWADPANALRLMGIFHWEHLGWTLLGVLGLGWLAYRRAWRPLVLLLGWELLVVVLLSQKAPLWGHLLIPLAPPVILAAAIALAEAARQQPRLVLVGLAVVLFLALWPRALAADRATITPPAAEAMLRDEIVPWVRTSVPADERILTDDLMIAVHAGRLVPHDMSDTSFTRIHAGFLTVEQLIAATERDRPALIIFWSDRFNSLPAWREWVQAHYLVSRQLSEGQLIFSRPDLPPTTLPTP